MKQKTENKTEGCSLLNGDFITALDRIKKIQLLAEKLKAADIKN